MKIYAVAALVALTSCSQGARLSQQTVNAMSPNQLNVQAEKYDGVEVAVRGFLLIEAENYALWDSAEDFKRSEAAHCISVMYPKSVAKQLQQENRRMVVLNGVFRKNMFAERPGEVFLGLCNVTAIEVSPDKAVMRVP